jgi:hypothetical protein
MRFARGMQWAILSVADLSGHRNVSDSPTNPGVTRSNHAGPTCPVPLYLSPGRWRPPTGSLVVPCGPQARTGMGWLSRAHGAHATRPFIRLLLLVALPTAEVVFPATGANAPATMFPKLSYGCQTRPARRHRQHRLTQADLSFLISGDFLDRRFGQISASATSHPRAADVTVAPALSCSDATDENSGTSPSAKAGCVRTASRRTVYGSPPITAT